jgi:peptidoglycan hydrolase-like protein with peptidoglycan-binding domain
MTGTTPFGTRLLLYRKQFAYMRGEDVRNVQRRLLHLGFDPKGIDGVYGPQTEAAVRRFQASAGITMDGIVGPETRARLSE